MNQWNLQMLNGLTRAKALWEGIKMNICILEVPMGVIIQWSHENGYNIVNY